MAKYIIKIRNAGDPRWRMITKHDTAAEARADLDRRTSRSYEFSIWYRGKLLDQKPPTLHELYPETPPLRG